jgi:hypothetical protein
VMYELRMSHKTWIFRINIYSNLLLEWSKNRVGSLQKILPEGTMYHVLDFKHGVLLVDVPNILE